MQGEIAETLHFMVSPVGRRVCTFDDLLPCIEKITLLSEEEDRILEAHQDAPLLSHNLNISSLIYYSEVWRLEA